MTGWSRALAGWTGAATAAVAAASVPGRGPLPGDPAVALCATGTALVLLAAARPGSATARAGRVLAALAAGAAAAGLGRQPAAAVAVTLAALALVVLDVRVPHRAGDAVGYRAADPPLAAAATVALTALVVPGAVPGPAAVPAPPLAAALLLLVLGAVLARPEARPDTPAPPGAPPPETVPPGSAPPAGLLRRALPALAAVPAVGLVAALAAGTGTGPPAALAGAAAVLAALGVLALVAYLVRSLEGATARQRALAADLRTGRAVTDTLLASVQEAVLLLDADRRVVEANGRWRELTGHDPADTLGRTPPYPWQEDGGTAAAGRADGTAVRRADGTTVPVRATLAAVPGADGRPGGYVATFAGAPAAEALHEHAAELERGNDRLREANRRLADALTFKNDLTSMLTHDVNQPISSIASLAELLSSDWAGLSDDIRHELAVKIDRNTQRLIKMMNDLQLLFRLDTGAVTARRTPVPVGEVVRAAVDRLAPGGVEVTVGDPAAGDGPAALADREHLTAVVQNLLRNALAYGAPPVRVSAERRGDTVEIVVADHGPGIADELVPQLFDRFVKGAGLGLFIVRHLVEANGGAVRYERAHPRGARLVVTLEAGR